MKQLVTLALATGLCLSCATGAGAIDFQAKGQWYMGFIGGQSSLVSRARDNGRYQKADGRDKFYAEQRIRLQIDAVASESLSGTVYFEIGNTRWGHAASGGALGADAKMVEVKRAYVDWAVPDTDLSFRMGIQALTFPNAACGSAIADDDAAGVSFSWKFSENASLIGMWARPLNDNYTSIGEAGTGNDKNNFLDNFDLFMLGVPLAFDGVEVTPWVMYGLVGQNAFREHPHYALDYTMSAFYSDRWMHRWGTDAAGNPVELNGFGRKGKAWTSAFWAGLPVKLTLWDPLSIEFDVNYGYVEGVGRGTIMRSDGRQRRYDTRREGWLAKALVEYKMDWGVLGLFGWYGSGDDGNPSNGSERMPSVSPCAWFTSFFGGGNLDWPSNGYFTERNLSLSGTWGIGAQIRDVSFVDDLKHTFRVAWWGGTNSPKMAKYASGPARFDSNWGEASYTANEPEVYLTTSDGLLEFNLVNSYKMYDNFEVNFELGYVVNFVDQSTWRKANNFSSSAFSKQDAWKAQLIFAYTF
jgi:hypothetical protein